MPYQDRSPAEIARGGFDLSENDVEEAVGSSKITDESLGSEAVGKISQRILSQELSTIERERVEVLSSFRIDDLDPTINSHLVHSRLVTGIF